jgi:two-component system sensor histidine kinase SenX3
MRFLPKDRALTWAVPTVLTAVLIALAILQYRWSRQVSEAAATEMHLSLQNSMMNFRQDLSTELGAMCLQLAGDADSSSTDPKGLAQRLEHLRRTSVSPGLIENVYVWGGRGSSGANLSRLLPSESRFETIPWPPAFERVRELLSSAPPAAGGARGDQVSSRSEVSGTKSQSPAMKKTGRSANLVKKGNGSQELKPRRPEESRLQIIAGIDQQIPMLIVPMQTDESIWLLVELNSHSLEESILPPLALRYFGDGRTSDYQIAVLSDRGPGARLLYSSETDFTKGDETNADAILNIFGPPGGPRPPPLDLFRSKLKTLPPVTKSSSSSSLAKSGTVEPIRFDPIDTGVDSYGWQLAVRHRKGSLAAAMAALRFRNLEISFGVLLVLAISMALIIYASQRARRLATLQMEFIAGVSHELRTPVAAILSISENIADGVVDNRDQLLRYGGLIRNQARQLNHLVEQVLRFAALQGKTTYTIRQLQIPEVIEEVLENMANLISAAGYRVELQIDPNLPAVDADFGVLSQCLQNLISNAVKYGGQNKWIGIRGTGKQVGSASWVCVTVEDHGMGIDEEELKHIFEPFYRSPKVLESKLHGTGLGLALAKGFAETMGGRLSVTSEAGHGSSFTIELPAVEKTHAEQSSNGAGNELTSKEPV